MHLRSVSLIVISAVLASCNEKSNLTEAKQQIIQTDIAFSNMSKAEGMKNAFVQFIDDEGVLLRPNLMPIVGADAIDYLTQTVDTGFTLTWEPTAARVAKSGDLGYTYGVYTLELKDTVLKGTYINIWEKQPNGKWKLVLDSGNDGISEEKKDTLTTQY
jgi:ketosteroid isomerase-like protein